MQSATLWSMVWKWCIILSSHVLKNTSLFYISSYFLLIYFLVYLLLFSPLGKPADRAIYFTLRFFLFYISSFIMIFRRQIIWRSTGPIFAIFTSNESILAVDERSGPLFSISQGTLPWQPILCKNCIPPCTYGSGIQKRYGLSSCGWTH